MSKRTLDVSSDASLSNKLPKVGLFTGLTAVFVGIEIHSIFLIKNLLSSTFALPTHSIQQTGREDIQFGILRSNFIKNGGKVIDSSSTYASSSATHIICRTNQVTTSEVQRVQGAVIFSFIIQRTTT